MNATSVPPPQHRRLARAADGSDAPERRFVGIPVSAGVAIGPVFGAVEPEPVIARQRIHAADIAAECVRRLALPRTGLDPLAAIDPAGFENTLALRALLRAKRESVLILARDLIVLSDVLGRLRHRIDAVLRLHQRIDEAPANGRVLDVGAALERLLRLAHHERRARHRLDTTGDDEIRLARADAAFENIRMDRECG